MAATKRKPASTVVHTERFPGESKDYRVAVLVFQDRSAFIPPYQARQLAKLIEKYGGEDA